MQNKLGMNLTNYCYCLLVLFLSACGTSNSSNHTETAEEHIDFLSVGDGQIAILDETFEPYFAQLQVREIEAFIQEKCPTTQLDIAREHARKKFASAVVFFTAEEKACMTFVIQKIDEILTKNQKHLMTKAPWKFIKIDSWLCGGFAHTRGEFIIISQKHIEHLSKGWSDNMTPEEEENLIKRFGGLLVHEKMHTLQRRHKDIFDVFYRDHWNFVQAKVQDDERITKHQVSNPDAPIAEWLIPNEVEPNQYYWVRTLLKANDGIPVMGRDFMDVVFSVEKDGENYTVVNDSLGEPKSMSMDDFNAYKNAFPVQRGLDHPNEITAYMFSEYFVALVEEEEPFEELTDEAAHNAQTFIEFLDTKFH